MNAFLFGLPVLIDSIEVPEVFTRLSEAEQNIEKPSRILKGTELEMPEILHDYFSLRQVFNQGHFSGVNH